MLHIYIVFFIIGPSLVQVCFRPCHDPYTDLAYVHCSMDWGWNLVGKHQFAVVTSNW